MVRFLRPAACLGLAALALVVPVACGGDDSSFNRPGLGPDASSDGQARDGASGGGGANGSGGRGGDGGPSGTGGTGGTDAGGGGGNPTADAALPDASRSDSSPDGAPLDGTAADAAPDVDLRWDSGPPCPVGSADAAPDVPCTSNGDCCGSGRVCGFRFTATTATYCAAPFANQGAVGAPCSGTLYPNDKCETGICLAPLGACTTLCRNDDDCGHAFVCAEIRVNATPFSFCAKGCTGDPSCSTGHLCVIRANGAADRLDEYCAPAPKTGDPPGSPASPNDPGTCDHGLVVTIGADTYCTAPCASDADCPASTSKCRVVNFTRPTSGTPYPLGLCTKP